MIESSNFLHYLQKSGIEFFVGVPDSLLKNFCFYIEENVAEDLHVIAANEGNALAIAAGYYLEKRKPALVYLQNSGIGNAINPLLSLTDKDVFGIPALLLVGWRGKPGTKDEPQHIKQGAVLTDLLKTLDISYFILEDDSEFEKVIDKAITHLDEYLKGK